MFPKGNLTPKTMMAPAAAFTMACVLFAYTRSSIKEARRSARSSREAQTGRQHSQQQQQQQQQHPEEPRDRANDGPRN